MKKFTTLIFFSICMLYGCSKEDDPIIPVVTEICFDDTPTTIQLGGYTTLNVDHTPSDLTAPTYSWSSSDDSIIKVTQSGFISAEELGTAVISVITESGLTASCTITVIPVEATDLQLNKYELALYVGETEELTCQVYPYNTTDKTITWSSSDDSVATVQDGLITAINDGVAQIKVESNTGIFSVCDVTVSSIKIENISISENDCEIIIGQQKLLEIVFTPTNPTNKNITWSSSNDDIVKVDENGYITGIMDGTAVITATSEDGNITATCNVKVNINGISLTYAELEILPNDTKLIHVTYLNSDKAYTNAIWSSSNPEVATITGDGQGTNSAVIEAKSVGTTVITATTEDGQRYASCTVTVADITSFLKTDYTLNTDSYNSAGLLTANLESLKLYNNSTQSIQVVSFQIYSVIGGVIYYTHYARSFSNFQLYSMYYLSYNNDIPIEGWYNPKYKWEIIWNNTTYTIEGDLKYYYYY